MTGSALLNEYNVWHVGLQQVFHGWNLVVILALHKGSELLRQSQKPHGNSDIYHLPLGIYVI